MIRQKRKKVFLLNFTFVLLIIGILLFSLVGLRAMWQKKQVIKEIDQLEKELESVNLTKNNFLKSVEDCQSEFFLEQEARTKLNFKKAGETVVVISDSELGVKDELNELSKKNKVFFSNIIKWWEYFFSDERFVS